MILSTILNSIFNLLWQLRLMAASIPCAADAWLASACFASGRSGCAAPALHTRLRIQAVGGHRENPVHKPAGPPPARVIDGGLHEAEIIGRRSYADLEAIGRPDAIHLAEALACRGLDRFHLR